MDGASNTAGRFTATATLQQSGRTVTGTYRNANGAEFRLDGTVSGNHVQKSLMGTNNPAVCDFERTFVSDGTVGSGSYTCGAERDGDWGCHHELSRLGGIAASFLRQEESAASHTGGQP